MMQPTRSLATLTAACTIAAFAFSSMVHGRTIYSESFDYKKFPALSIYFEGKSLKEIDQFCKSGQNASADDAAACGQWDFEHLNSTLNATYAKVLNSIKKSDKELAEYHAPLAAPDFVGAQESWFKYRDRYCYSYVYALGEASGRYIYFWDCMKEITEDRIKQRERFSQ
ncbi:lysozyme inhibitor LprI family protein [Paraburkholderia sp. BR13439]|uniref:lysozyme inhibitor LprI family protein n=1 Tax=Paraburkholderia sp. BR13439 TaxID=3236996 RepID=UPI0034D02252